MVKSPSYQAAEEDREYMIPKAFDEYSGNKYQLKRIKPQDYPRLTIAYIETPIRPTFAIYDQGGEVVAEFHPCGYAKCKKDTFRPIFEKMVNDIEESVQRVLRKYKNTETSNLHMKD